MEWWIWMSIVSQCKCCGLKPFILWFLLFNFSLFYTALSYDTFVMYHKRKRFGVSILDGPSTNGQIEGAYMDV